MVDYVRLLFASCQALFAFFHRQLSANRHQTFRSAKAGASTAPAKRITSPDSLSIPYKELFEGHFKS
jgi:hypothetical protein